MPNWEALKRRNDVAHERVFGAPAPPWPPGATEDEIARAEEAVGMRFDPELRSLLAFAAGTPDLWAMIRFFSPADYLGSELWKAVHANIVDVYAEELVYLCGFRPIQVLVVGHSHPGRDLLFMPRVPSARASSVFWFDCEEQAAFPCVEAAVRMFTEYLEADPPLGL